MSSAIGDLQRAILSGQQSLTQLLRQAKIIAAKLNLEDIEQWVDLELGGYAGKGEVPDYRKIFTNSLEINNPYRGGWVFAGNLNYELDAPQPIAEIEGMSKGYAVAFPVTENFTITDTIGTTGQSRFPQRFTVVSSQYKRILDAVTDKLIQLTTELDKRGIKGENMNFDEKEKQAAASQVFHIGSVQNLVGNANHSPVTYNDNRTVNQLLIEKNIPKQDRRELEDIIDELQTAPADKKPSLIERGEKLIVKHKDALGASAEILGKLIHGLKGTE